MSKSASREALGLFQFLALRGVLSLGCLLLLGLVVPASASIWGGSVVPAVPAVANDSLSVTLGLKFYSDVPGFVTAIRFYKGSGNRGTHVGALWTSTGQLLASVTFTATTRYGWQQMAFSQPVAISAGTVYVVSYLAPQGAYADDQQYAWTSIDASPLHVADAAPGVYAYGSSIAFPDGAWNGSNYYVDLVFSPSAPIAPATYSITGTVAGTAATLTLSGTTAASTATSPAGLYAFSGLANGDYVVAPSESGYTFTPNAALVTVDSANVTGANFTGVAVQLTVHSAALSWTPSPSPNISGYRAYRSAVSGSSYALLNSTLISGTAFTDTAVTSGSTYYYVITAVDNNGVESGYSNQAAAVIPTP